MLALVVEQRRRASYVPINLDLNMLMPAPIVNVPSSPPVNVRNEVNVPQAQSFTIRRDSDGKITGAPILSAAADVGTIARSRNPLLC
jgi:hypothetical protein